LFIKPFLAGDLVPRQEMFTSRGSTWCSNNLHISQRFVGDYVQQSALVHSEANFNNTELETKGVPGFIFTNT
jgi:hypothetical protein